MLSHYLEIVMEYLHESITKVHPPFEFLTNLYGVQNPFNRDWSEGNEAPSLVSEISTMSILISIMKDNTAQKIKFSIKDFFSKCDQIRSFKRNASNLFLLN